MSSASTRNCRTALFPLAFLLAGIVLLVAETGCADASGIPRCQDEAKMVVLSTYSSIRCHPDAEVSYKDTDQGVVFICTCRNTPEKVTP